MVYVEKFVWYSGVAQTIGSWTAQGDGKVRISRDVLHKKVKAGLKKI